MLEGRHPLPEFSQVNNITFGTSSTLAALPLAAPSGGRMALEQDPSGLLLRATVDGRTVFLWSHRAGKQERAAAANSLATSGFAVVDHFLGAALALRLREDGLKMWRRAVHH